jgi:type II secretory ATPase GspE/PulE/Tfp pilus assembly ATPase PilB-like protein
MPDIVLSSVVYGGYISIIKIVIFLVLFIGWLWTVGWVNRDAYSVGTNQNFWTAIVFGAGVFATILWLLIPMFLIGFALFLIAAGASSLSYVSHRNGLVMEHDRVLTPDFIKGLLESKGKKLEESNKLVFETANGNEVPIPQSRTPDFYGFREANELFSDAVWRRASEIVFVPTPEEHKVVYQVDGAAIKRPSISKEQMEYLAVFIKNVADLDVKERRKPQKSKLTTRRGKENIEWEVTTAGSRAGEHIVLKQKMQRNITKIAELGLMSAQEENLSGIASLNSGVFIISGTKKSGVSTTFYSLLRCHDAYINSIHTLEREITGDLMNMTQEVYSFSDTSTMTFGKKLEGMFRMGPDVCGVAGCQDSETAQAICEAAKKGIMVYVTLEAESVIKAVDKWIRLVGDKNKAIQNLAGISNQRLIRVLCEGCKQAYTPNVELLKKFNLPPEKAKVLHRPGKVQYDKHGKSHTCEDCQGTGFVGRTSIFELVTIDDSLREMLVKAQSISEIASRFRGAKMLYLQEQALRKVIAGITSINEMVRVLAKPAGEQQKKVAKPNGK